MFKILESAGARLVDRFVPAINAAAMPGTGPPGTSQCTPACYAPGTCPAPGCFPNQGCSIGPDCTVACT